jgi:hypothetical protein
METRTVTASGTVLITDEYIICNSSSTIALSLNKSSGNSRELIIKNIGSGAVAICPVVGDYIDGGSIFYLNQWEGAKLQDDILGTWLVTPYQVVNEGDSALNYSFNVDGSRTDPYTPNGSEAKPYKTVKAAVEAIQILANAQIALGTQVAYDTTRYVINVLGGIYSDIITIGNMKYLGIQLNGATLSGQINITTTQVGGPVTDDYSKVEFIGSPSSRAYRGRRGYISGNIVMTRNNASLMYVNFTGVEVAGNVSVGTSTADSSGSWVVGLQNAYFSNSSKFISCYTADPTAYLMLESFAYNVIKCKIAKQDSSATQVELYNCNNTSFENDINTTPTLNQTIKNCTFTSSKTFSIVAVKTLYIDAISYKQLMAGTETLTGMTISYLDNIGANPTPVTRTVGQLVAGNTVNDNIDLLDTVIGADPSPAGTRTAGTIAVANSVNANIDALDAAIGFEAQMSGSPVTVTKTGTVFQMIDQLDTYKSVRTIKKTIGAPGLGGVDFNFTSAANQTEQVINLGALIPAKARLVDIFSHTDAVFTGAVSLAADFGTTSGGDELIASGTVYAAQAILAAANAGAFIATPAAAATNVYGNFTPGANWDQVTAGSLSVYITVIDVTHV